MNRPIERPPTYQDILALPENLVEAILGGQLHTTPRPAPKHARSASALTGSLWNPFDGGIGGPGGLRENGPTEIPDRVFIHRSRANNSSSTGYPAKPDKVSEQTITFCFFPYPFP